MGFGRGATIILVGLSLAACGVKKLTPPVFSDHTGDQWVDVPYPPPPPHVDVLAEKPKELKNPIWIDGSWRFRGKRWLWDPGSWVEMAEGDTYAKPLLYRKEDGKLVWFEGRMHRHKDPSAPDPSSSASSSDSAPAPDPPPADSSSGNTSEKAAPSASPPIK